MTRLQILDRERVRQRYRREFWNMWIGGSMWFQSVHWRKLPGDEWRRIMSYGRPLTIAKQGSPDLR